ncbi:MAG TPA: hypothetical protein ENN19_09670 [Chloroflexi bacterium]|nr:hypothetical protein [Chloroflexota bacterium]
MKKSICFLILSLLLTNALAFTAAADDPDPVVRAVLFWSENCSHCHHVIENTLPPLLEKHGEQLEVLSVSLSDSMANYELWLATKEAFGIPPDQGGVPMLFIGEYVLVGSRDIPDRLPGLIERYLEAGGVGYPDVPGYPTEEPAVEPTATPGPTVSLYFFSDRLCEECTVVEREVLEPLQEQYGPQLIVERRDVEGSAENYNLLRNLEQQAGLTRGEMPVVFIGENGLSGEESIRAQLPGLIEQYLATGGAPLPEASVQAQPTPGGDASQPEIHLAYFYQPGCRECDRVELDLNYLKHQYPQLVIHEFNVREQEGAALCDWLGEHAGVPEKKRMVAPAAFVGDDALVDEELHARNLQDLVARYVDTGAEAIWEQDLSLGQTITAIIERFKSFGLLTVLGAGLIDGLNPCAFATLVFFISYLTFTGRKGNEVLLSGLAFTLGVFLTYLGVGIGFLKFLATLPFLDAISRWIYGATALLCIVLAIGSIYDWWQARRGKADDMRLKLPTKLRKRINKAIRERASMRAFIPMTFLTGVVVSVIELACTGQVYLPTIVFVLGIPELQAQAFLYLLLYNLMFILPLVLVFVMAYYGTTSEELGLFVHRQMASIKLVTAGLFILLASWLIATII